MKIFMDMAFDREPSSQKGHHFWFEPSKKEQMLLELLPCSSSLDHWESGGQGARSGLQMTDPRRRCH
jgi:hypothetical protein